MKKARFLIVAICVALSVCCAEAVFAATVEEGLVLLKQRRDSEAKEVFAQVLASEPQNIDAQWGEAELLRRRGDYVEAERIYQEILSKNPEYIPALLSLGLQYCKLNKLKEVTLLIGRVSKLNILSSDDYSMLFVLLGAFNSKKAEQGGLVAKIRYGSQIKGYFKKAVALAPDLPDARLGLGTYYLFAPAVAGGNLNQAIKELEYATNLAPRFASAYARLAQAYQKKKDIKHYNFYLHKAREIDAQNEVVQELLQVSL